MKKNLWQIIGSLAIILFLAAGCSGQTDLPQEPAKTPEGNTGMIVAGPGSFDSADTAVITGIDSVEETVTFLNLMVGKRYTLSYDGTTVITDKYEQAMSMAQLQEGDIVDVTFLRGKKFLNSIRLSGDSFVYNEVSRFEINTLRNDITLGSSIYKISDDTVIFSEGREIELMDINASDILTVCGIENNVYSIVVEKGHGYLKLSNDEKFIGGFIEVGQSQITQIEEDMLLVVPEGSYQVQISHKGGGGTKQIVINRGEEVTLDIGDLTIPEPKYGNVIFTLNPSNLKLYIDGEEVDATGEVKLSYGIHQLVARADGYATATSYLKVDGNLLALDVVLESLNSKENGNTDTGNDNSDNTENSGDKEDVSGNGVKEYQVRIDTPEDVEVYLDGNYLGLTPVSFVKTPGTHVITLRKSGYETRSYTIQIDSEAKDVNYVFAPLEESDS